MEIKAKARLDLDAIKALTHLAMFKKEDPKKRMIFWFVAYSVLLAVLILEGLFLGFDWFVVFMIAIDVIINLLGLYSYFLVPKIRYNAMAKMKDAENEYVFTENKLKISTQNAEYNGESEIEYSFFVKVFETSKYLFLYQTNNQVYIVDKSTVVGGTLEEIRNKLLEAVKEKYVVCKY